MSNTIVYEDGTAFHPGSYLEDLLDDWQMTPAQFAHKLGKPLETVDQLLAGEIPVDLELASKLERSHRNQRRRLAESPVHVRRKGGGA